MSVTAIANYNWYGGSYTINGYARKGACGLEKIYETRTEQRDPRELAVELSEKYNCFIYVVVKSDKGFIHNNDPIHPDWLIVDKLPPSHLIMGSLIFEKEGNALKRASEA